LKCSWNNTLFPYNLVNSTQFLESSTFNILTHISVLETKLSCPVVSMVNLILYLSSLTEGSIFNLFLKYSTRASSIKSGLHVEKNCVFYSNTFSYVPNSFYGVRRTVSVGASCD